MTKELQEDHRGLSTCTVATPPRDGGSIRHSSIVLVAVALVRAIARLVVMDKFRRACQTLRPINSVPKGSVLFENCLGVLLKLAGSGCPLQAASARQSEARALGLERLPVNILLFAGQS